MKTKDILRWLGLLPCAIIGSVFAAVLIVMMCLIGEILDGSFWTHLQHPEVIYLGHFFTPFITTAVLCGAFVFIGRSIAPRFKRQIGYALSIVVAILFGILAFFAVLSHEWKFLAQCLFGIIVAAIVAYNEEYD